MLTHFCYSFIFFFFFNDTATTEIYTLSLHDALPISRRSASGGCCRCTPTSARRSKKCAPATSPRPSGSRDRKSTRLNSSHTVISYAVFCLKKKKNKTKKKNTNNTEEKTIHA